MGFNMCFVFLIITVSAVTAKTRLHPLSDEFISSINQEQSSWKAGRNFDITTPMSHLRTLMGLVDIPPKVPVSTRNFHPSSLLEIPESFDAREAWPNCQSLRHIRDQSECGSCWAVAAAAAMTDRLCIKSGGNSSESVSAADLMECCSSCGNGCNGGSAVGPWIYWKEHGIATGGDYRSNKGCKNYPFAPCEHAYARGNKPRCSKKRLTPQCKNTCDGNALTYGNQLTRGKSVYYLATEQQIQADILENGPVEAGMEAFEDFASYKEGVYFYTRGKTLGGHAVKIIGWGVENNLPYWLVANSWNEDWGDKGYFKILRGRNECGIESMVYAGQPLVEYE